MVVTYDGTRFKVVKIVKSTSVESTISKLDEEYAVLGIPRGDRSPGTDEQPNLNRKVFKLVLLIALKDYDAAFGWLEKDKSMLLVKPHFYIPSKQTKKLQKKDIEAFKDARDKYIWKNFDVLFKQTNSLYEIKINKTQWKLSQWKTTQ
ncbi:hypothetical protein BpHYR1_009555 [Brachionus plicatilis]|uniref:Uncharacterized protein n=1 Tax=Brachionus plicatilis TaxID=10195 RepID=A0A3M7RDR2_BRAPC|nr:hypothetical protein BpHYR1_009555 [Brachionus plicatilis]